jgi:putative ABC transport system substrate-binding protein
VDRRAFLGTLTSDLLAARLTAVAQPGTIRRIGVLSPASPGPSPLLSAFQQGLREAGYVKGANIRLEYRFAETRLERLPGLAAELVRLKVDVILAIKANRTIPIVFT